MQVCEKKLHFNNKFVLKHSKIFDFYMYLCTQFAAKRGIKFLRRTKLNEINQKEITNKY